MTNEPILPTPDWRTLTPRPSDTDIFTEQSGYNDAVVTGWDGRNVFGVTIGLVQMHVNLAMIPGNMGNATTFDFPILYRRMNARDVADVMAEEPTQNFADAIVEAAQWLELQGVRAIMGNCGFFGGYQNEVKARINVPFFSSSLMMLPMMVHSMPGGKRVGVITAKVRFAIVGFRTLLGLIESPVLPVQIQVIIPAARIRLSHITLIIPR